MKSEESGYFSEVIDKISRDIDFLRFSYLRRFIEFSSNHDPLFIVPLKKFENLECANCSRRSIIELFTLKSEYRKRLKMADNFSKRICGNLEAV